MLFDKCEQLDKPKWLRFLPPNDNDQLREDLRSLTQADNALTTVMVHCSPATSLPVLGKLKKAQAKPSFRPQ